MTEKRKIRGLLDVLLAVAEGVEWEMDEISADFFPGMGLGATEQAKRWAWIGYNVEIRDRIAKQLKRPRGRPRVKAISNKDSFRAYSLWNFMRNIRKKSRQASLTNRELIKIARQVESALGVPISQRAFPPQGNFEASVSRGKANLEIDDNWYSAVCDKIAEI